MGGEGGSLSSGVMQHYFNIENENLLKSVTIRGVTTLGSSLLSKEDVGYWNGPKEPKKNLASNTS